MTSNQELDAIVLKAQGGAREAIRELIMAVQSELCHFVAARAPSPTLMDEIVQSALVTAIEQLSDYQPRESFMPWIKGIALNQLRTEMRRLRRQVTLDADHLESLVLDEAESKLDGDDGDNTIVHLRACVESLPPRARLILNRYYTEDLSLKRMARQFKQNERALGMTLFRIRESIRHCLATKGVVA